MLFPARRLIPLAAVLLAVAAPASAQGTNPCAPDEGLVLRTLRILGVAAMPGQIKGSDDAPAGDLYLTSADGQGSQLRLTEGGGFRSPIFAPDDESVLALWRGQLVELTTGRGVVQPIPRIDLKGAVRLAGLLEGYDDAVVVLVKDGGHRRPLLVCLGRRQTRELTGGRSDVHFLLKRLRSGGRLYDGGIRLETRRQKSGRDVVLHRADATALNLTRCHGVTCSQGALSRDGRRVVFVRTEVP